MKRLKYFNGTGRVHRSGKTTTVSINIAAYSQKQAAELLDKFNSSRGSLNQIRNYYSPMWDNDMDQIVVSEPCLYIVQRGQPRVKFA